MLNKKVVRAKNGAAVVSPTEIIEIRGTWTSDELMKVFEAMDTLVEVRD